MAETATLFNPMAISVSGLVAVGIAIFYFQSKVFGHSNPNHPDSNSVPKSILAHPILKLILSFALSYLIGIQLTINVQHGETEFHTFKHGAYHGMMTAIYIALPIIVLFAYLENKSWKFLWAQISYWVISFAIMGGILCAWR